MQFATQYSQIGFCDNRRAVVIFRRGSEPHMQIPTDWSQRQNAALDEYKQCFDPVGFFYAKLFSRLVWTETAKSWQDFLEWIEILQGAWCFRGQRESAWTLQTSLERSVKVSHENVRVITGGHEFLSSGHSYLDRPAMERELLFRFQQQAHQFIPHTPPIDDKASWFALMQHYGAPTRLLDWTSSPYVALYFAVEEKPAEKNNEKDEGEEEKDGGYSAVWAIDLDWLKMKEQKYLESIDPKGKTAFLSGSVDQSDTPLVVKVDPLQGNERMFVQQGFFLWKLYEEMPYLDQILIDMMTHPLQERPVICKLKVGKELRIELLERLQNMNIHRGSLFPGLDGFCKFLKSDLEIKVAKEARLQLAEMSR